MGPRRRWVWLIALLGAVYLLGACGNKGPLYLPKAGEEQGTEAKRKAEAR